MLNSPWSGANGDQAARFGGLYSRTVTSFIIKIEPLDRKEKLFLNFCYVTDQSHQLWCLYLKTWNHSISFMLCCASLRNVLGFTMNMNSYLIGWRNLTQVAVEAGCFWGLTGQVQAYTKRSSRFHCVNRDRLLDLFGIIFLMAVGKHKVEFSLNGKKIFAQRILTPLRVFCCKILNLGI